MSDAELRAIRQNKLRELQRRLATRQKENNQASAEEVLSKIFRGRAWEVFNEASRQYPNAMLKLKTALVHLASSGRIEQITGEQLFLFLRNLGLKVRLNTKIRFTENGKLKSLSDKVREELRKG